jgi:hypothetical protein
MNTKTWTILVVAGVLLLPAIAPCDACDVTTFPMIGGISLALPDKSQTDIALIHNTGIGEQLEWTMTLPITVVTAV